MVWKAVFLLFASVCAVVPSFMTGGLTSVGLADFGNDTLGQDALRFAVSYHNRRSNDMFHHGVSHIVSVQKQVVAGLRYIITVNMAKTTCRKSNEEKTCLPQSVHGKPTVEQCTFDLWMRPWLTPSITVQNETCTRETNDVGSL